MTEGSLFIPTKSGIKLNALLRKLQGAGKFPAVLFVSGLGMTMHEWNNSFDEIAKRLVEDGFATLQFTFDIFKNNETRELPLKKRAEELKDVIEWVANQPFVDTAHIGLVAQSYGVATALTADLSIIKSIVFVSGTYNLEEAIERVYQERGVIINYRGDTTLPRSSGEYTTVDERFWQDAKRFDVVGLAGKLKTQSVIVVHGDKDTKISPEEAQKFYTSLGTKNKKLKIFVGGDHGISDVPRAMREEFITFVVEWFGKTLKMEI